MTNKHMIIDIKDTINKVKYIRKMYFSLLDKYKHKEQECEELKKELHQNFKEKDKLNLIIYRLLEASGYDTNTASAKDFEYIYENIRYEKQQLDKCKSQLLDQEAETLKAGGIIYNLEQTLTEIKEIVKYDVYTTRADLRFKLDLIKNKIKEYEVYQNDGKNNN